MLADTDAGSVITAAQSGAQWGYRLLLLQFLMIPLLYVAQELTVRLALCTGKTYGELLRRHFGRGPALLATAALVVSCVGALLTEMSGLAGVGQLYEIPVWQTTGLVTALIFAMVCTGSYASMERLAIALGLCELAFLLVAWRAKPDLHQIASQLGHMPLTNHAYLYLLAANLGTCIMPWTLFYQQSALVGKGLDPSHLKAARLDTLIGAILCQLITAAVLVAAAAALGAKGGGTALRTVPQVAQAFILVLGEGTGRILFAAALSGGALVSTIVVCLCLVWALEDLTGPRTRHPAAGRRYTLRFYLGFGAILLAAAGLVISRADLVRMSIATGVVNAILLPLVLSLLFWLARRALPPAYRLKGPYMLSVGLAFLASAGIGCWAALAGIRG
jgi:Mn2+/Fe2+ NRAMP family transporter